MARRALASGLGLAMGLVCGLASTAALGEPAQQRIHAELDPLPFVRSGYGGQLGYRWDQVRVAIASFSLDVPDLVTELGDDNDGFHLRVRPSVALYGLYYFSKGQNGFAAGGSLRYLRLRYTHDDFPGEASRVGEFSIEGIVAYKWHPFEAGFYVQPWFALARTVASRGGDVVVGDREYSALPIQAFFTVNLGWELEL